MEEFGAAAAEESVLSAAERPLRVARWTSAEAAAESTALIAAQQHRDREDHLLQQQVAAIRRKRKAKTTRRPKQEQRKVMEEEKRRRRRRREEGLNQRRRRKAARGKEHERTNAVASAKERPAKPQNLNGGPTVSIMDNDDASYHIDTGAWEEDDDDDDDDDDEKKKKKKIVGHQMSSSTALWGRLPRPLKILASPMMLRQTSAAAAVAAVISPGSIRIRPTHRQRRRRGDKAASHPPTSPSPFFITDSVLLNAKETSGTSEHLRVDKPAPAYAFDDGRWRSLWRSGCLRERDQEERKKKKEEEEEEKKKKKKKKKKRAEEERARVHVEALRRAYSPEPRAVWFGAARGTTAVCYGGNVPLAPLHGRHAAINPSASAAEAARRGNRKPRQAASMFSILLLLLLLLCYYYYCCCSCCCASGAGQLQTANRNASLSPPSPLPCLVEQTNHRCHVDNRSETVTSALCVCRAGSGQACALARGFSLGRSMERRRRAAVSAEQHRHSRVPSAWMQRRRQYWPFETPRAREKGATTELQASIATATRSSPPGGGGGGGGGPCAIMQSLQLQQQQQQPSSFPVRTAATVPGEVAAASSHRTAMPVEWVDRRRKQQQQRQQLLLLLPPPPRRQRAGGAVISATLAAAMQRAGKRRRRARELSPRRRRTLLPVNQDPLWSQRQVEHQYRRKGVSVAAADAQGHVGPFARSGRYGLWRRRRQCQSHHTSMKHQGEYLNYWASYCTASLK